MSIKQIKNGGNTPKKPQVNSKQQTPSAPAKNTAAVKQQPRYNFNQGKSNNESVFKFKLGNGTKVTKNAFTSRFQEISQNEDDKQAIEAIWSILDADSSGDIDDKEYESAIKFFGSDKDEDGKNDSLTIEDMLEQINTDSDDVKADFQEAMIKQYGYLKETGVTDSTLEEYLINTLQTDEFYSYISINMDISTQEAQSYVIDFINETVEYAQDKVSIEEETPEEREARLMEPINSLADELKGEGIRPNEQGEVIFRGETFNGAYATKGTKAILKAMKIDLSQFPEIEKCETGRDLQKIALPVDSNTEIKIGDTVITGIDENTDIHSGAVTEIVYDNNNNIIGYKVAEANSDANDGGFIENFYGIEPTDENPKHILGVIETSPFREKTVNNDKNPTLKTMIYDGSMQKPDGMYPNGLYTSPLLGTYTLEYKGRTQTYVTIASQEEIDNMLEQIETVGAKNDSGHDSCCLLFSEAYCTWFMEGMRELSSSDVSYAVCNGGGNKENFNNHAMKTFETEQEFYDYCYDSLSRGIPVIINVSKLSDGPHYVMLTGMSQDAADRGKIVDDSELLIIDTQDGKIEGMGGWQEGMGSRTICPDNLTVCPPSDEYLQAREAMY